MLLWRRVRTHPPRRCRRPMRFANAEFVARQIPPHPLYSERAANPAGNAELPMDGTWYPMPNAVFRHRVCEIPTDQPLHPQTGRPKAHRLNEVPHDGCNPHLSGCEHARHTQGARLLQGAERAGKHVHSFGRNHLGQVLQPQYRLIAQQFRMI